MDAETEELSNVDCCDAIRYGTGTVVVCWVERNEKWICSYSRIRSCLRSDLTKLYMFLLLVPLFGLLKWIKLMNVRPTSGTIESKSWKLKPTKRFIFLHEAREVFVTTIPLFSLVKFKSLCFIFSSTSFTLIMSLLIPVLMYRSSNIPRIGKELFRYRVLLTFTFCGILNLR